MESSNGHCTGNQKALGLGLGTKSSPLPAVNVMRPYGALLATLWEIKSSLRSFLKRQDSLEEAASVEQMVSCPREHGEELDRQSR